MHQQVIRPPGVKKKRRKWYGWLMLAGVALIAFGGFVGLRMGPQPIQITTEKASVRDITQLVSATGKIRPEVEVKISPEVAGEIIDLPVVVGQQLRRGDLILKIKPDAYLAQVKQGEASLSSAKADCLMRKAQMLNDELDLHRSQDLFQKKLVSETDYKAVETKCRVSEASYESSTHQIDVAKSSLDQAKDRLEKTVIFAPMDGTVSVLNSEVGERVVATGDFAGTEVMRIANLNSMEARVDVNENDVVNVHVGEKARVKVDAYPGRELAGVVKQIASTATVKGEGTQQEVTNFEVRIELVKPNVQLRPGMSASVDVESQTVHQVVAVPIQSVTVRSLEKGETADKIKVDREKQTGFNTGELEKNIKNQLSRVVFLKEGGRAKMVSVETGIADNNYIEVRSGIRAGDEVISGSYTALSKDLKDGSKVTIEKSKDST